MAGNEDLWDFLKSDDWWEYQQRKHVRALDGQVDALHRSLASERSQRAAMAEQQQKLESIIERQSQSIAAFSELDEVRARLSAFGDHVRFRQSLGRILASAMGGEPPSSGAAPALSEVDEPGGYWLIPAGTIFSLVVSGMPVPDALVTEAHALDPRRSAIFLAASLGAAGRTEAAAPWLDALLGFTPGAAVTCGQRVVWQSAADGVFGAWGRSLLAERLAALVGAAGTDADRHWRELWWDDGPEDELGWQRSARVVATAADRLAFDAAESGSIDPGEVDALDGELTRVALGLMIEGTAEEMPLLRRAEELRAFIQDRPLAIEDWMMPAGDPLALLAEDAEQRDLRGTVARAVGARWLVEAVEDHAGVVARTEPIAHREIEVRGVRVSFGSSGLSEQRQREVRLQLRDGIGFAPTSALLRSGTFATAAVLAAASTVSLVARSRGLGIGFLLVALLFGAWGAGIIIGDARRRARSDAQERSDLTTVTEFVGAAAAQLASDNDALARTQSRVRTDLERIRATTSARVDHGR